MTMKLNIFDPSEFEPRGDCHIATAVIGAVGSVAGGLISGNAAESAADTQAAAADRATQAQLEMFGQAKEQLMPFINFGADVAPQLRGWINPTNASSPLSSLLKLTTPGADMTSTLEQTPGFQFTKNMGTQAVNNALAARGLAGPGGPLARAGADYASGLASNTWQNVVNSLLNVYTGGANSMQNAVNTGAGAAGTLTGAATNVGGQIGSNMIGAGNAQAAGTIGMGNALSGIAGGLGNYALLARLGGGGGGGLYGGFASPADAGWTNGVGTGGFNFLDAMAARGGKFKKGQRILVGEEGPELFVPTEDGSILPADITKLLMAASRKKGRKGATHG